MMKKYASVDDLPNELLTIIFRKLYRMHWKSAASTGSEKSWHGDAFAPSAFPFAQASVCRRWCALIAYYPAYWTRIAIVPHATPLHTVANYFDWSQGLPIDVLVKSDPNVDGVRALDEKSYVNALLPHISQNLHRIRTIVLSVLHHPSIPDLRQWLVGEAKILTRIELSHAGHPVPATLTLDSCGSNNQDNKEEPEFIFSAPKLDLLSIDWQTFSRACHSNKAWLGNMPELYELCLTPSGPCPPLEYLSIDAVIEPLDCARHHCHRFVSVSLQGVPFTTDHAVDPHYLDISSMVFEDLGGNDLARLIDRVPTTDSMVIKNCSLLGIEDVFSFTSELWLDKLGEECDLIGLFTHISAFALFLEDCPAFNNTILSFMSEGGSTGEDFPQKELNRLTLVQCMNFSVECLYHMVHARRMAAEANPSWDGTEEGLNEFDDGELVAIVTVKVIEGPLLSEEYRTKFKQLVPNFEWTNLQQFEGDRV